MDPYLQTGRVTLRRFGVEGADLGGYRYAITREQWERRTPPALTRP